MIDILFVLAGTYQQAVDAARDFPPKQRWRYVGEARHLMGSRGNRYIEVGTFWERRDAREIYDLARINGLDVIFGKGDWDVSRDIAANATPPALAAHADSEREGTR